jgi:hypothetical protein
MKAGLIERDFVDGMPASESSIVLAYKYSH